MVKQLWRCIKENNEWIDIFKDKYQINGFQRILENYSLPTSVLDLWDNFSISSFIISQGSQWVLGDGGNIRYWDDRWIGEGPLSNLVWASQFKEKCITLIGSWVADYISNGIWVDLRTLDASLSPLFSWLSLIIIPSSLVEDVVIWNGSTLGQFLMADDF
ncbi:hypothetical protein SUGI_0496000 [Cryptomeria japonica]|nr:hypothetical protein SUGI_0496000 [Cryptomeria japonica]